MMQSNSNSRKQSSISPTSNLKQNPTQKINIKSRSSTKQSILGVSNISVSIRSSKETRQKIAPTEPDADTIKSEKGIQVDEVEMIADNRDSGDGPKVLLPSAKVLQEIERNRQLKKQEQLKARLKETRKFEKHSAKEETHLTNLKEFMGKGAVSRKREPDAGSKVLLENSMKPASERTKNALEAYDRIKRKEEELLRMFSRV